MEKADNVSARMRSGNKYFYGIVVAILVILGIAIIFS